jgi:hypothetical protein
MVVGTVVRGGFAWVDLRYPGGGRFATSKIRYFLPYIPVIIFIFVSASTFVDRWFRLPSLHVAVCNREACSECKKCTRNCQMSIDVLIVVQKRGTCIDSCQEKILGYRFSSEPFRWKSFKNTKEGKAA